MAEQTLKFETEVSRLLDLVINSLYSHKEIFLRELVSNASDACDKLRYEAITRPELTKDDPEFRIRLIPDKNAGTLAIEDNGIGMGRDELISELGTIARSGTASFLDRLKTADPAKDASDLSLIGQFGVGFYSAFMVADTVEVTSKRAGEEQGWTWRSDGKGEYTVAEATRDGRGTTVTLHMKKDALPFLETGEITRIVREYSDHIAVPIVLAGEKINRAGALWARSKSDIKDEDYKEFYHHVGHAFDDPWLTLHFKAEGKIEYSALLFVPTTKPFDLFDPARRHRVKLYVKRVFITDKCEGLVPPWLRFLRGVVDSEDLPLNVSRETLQANPVIARIRQGLTRRVLGDLARKAEKEPEEYAKFWDQFGAVMKEGLYEDGENREELYKIVRFRSTASDPSTGSGLVGLDEYVARMRPGQDAIYTINGDELEALKKSPQLEGFAARGVEVLLLTDPVDEFWTASAGIYKGKPCKSAARAGADLGKIPLIEGGKKPEDAAADGKTDALVALIKLTLADAVKDVRASERLTESAVCLVADENDASMHLERLLKLHGQKNAGSKHILEINPGHPLIRALAERVGQEGASATLDDAAWLLLDQARILEGEAVPDPTEFARRLASVMRKGLS